VLLFLERMHGLWTIFKKDVIVFVMGVIGLHRVLSVLVQVRTRFWHLEGLLEVPSLRLRVLAVKTGAV